MTTAPIAESSDRHGRRAQLARQLRVDAVRAAATAGSGHLTSAVSAADPMTASSTNFIDAYSIKSLDAVTIHAAGITTGRVIVIEDQRPTGGLADAVAEVFDGDTSRPQLVRLGVRIMPTTGRADELLAVAGIDRNALARMVRRLLAHGIYTR